MLVDATACPQDIAYPTDIKILNASREKSEELIDVLYDRTIHGPKKLSLIERMPASSMCSFLRKKCDVARSFERL